MTDVLDRPVGDPTRPPASTVAPARPRLMKGNEAMADAAVEAGCDAYFGYPITPQAELLERMARTMPAAARVWGAGAMVFLGLAFWVFRSIGKAARKQRATQAP